MIYHKGNFFAPCGRVKAQNFALDSNGTKFPLCEIPLRRIGAYSANLDIEFLKKLCDENDSPSMQVRFTATTVKARFATSFL